MRLYLAGVGGANKEMLGWIRENYPDIGALAAYPNLSRLKKLWKFGFDDIMLDSGAYSAYNSGRVIEIPKLHEFYEEVKDRVSICVGLDVIADKEVGWESVRNWDEMRALGSDCIPTYHLGEENAVLDYYVENSEYVGVGGIAGVTSSWRQLIPPIEALFSRHPDHKFHLFGVNDVRVVRRFPFYSCDALSWRSGSRFGQVVTGFGRWFVSPRHKRSITPHDAEAFGLKDWLEERGVSYPLPEDFDFKILDRINIGVFYDILVKDHGVTVSHEDLALPQSLF